MIKHSSSWTSQCGVAPKQKGSSSSRRAPTIAYTTSVSFTDDRGPPAPGGRYHEGAEGEHDQAEWAEAGWMGGGGLLNRHSPIITFERLLVRCITPTYTCTYTIICPSFTSASLGHSNQHIIILIHDQTLHRIIFLTFCMNFQNIWILCEEQSSMENISDYFACANYLLFTIPLLSHLLCLQIRNMI